MALANADMVAALTKYLDERKSESKTCTFLFGDYGNKIQYGNQPSLMALLDNYKLLDIILPVLRGIYRKSTIVRASFVACKSSWKHGNINVSDFDDIAWA